MFAAPTDKNNIREPSISSLVIILHSLIRILRTTHTALHSPPMPTYMTRHYSVLASDQHHVPVFHQLAHSIQNSKSERRPVAVSPQNSNVAASALALFQSGAGGN